MMMMMMMKAEEEDSVRLKEPTRSNEIASDHLDGRNVHYEYIYAHVCLPGDFNEVDWYVPTTTVASDHHVDFHFHREYAIHVDFRLNLDVDFAKQYVDSVDCY